MKVFDISQPQSTIVQVSHKCFADSLFFYICASPIMIEEWSFHSSLNYFEILNIFFQSTLWNPWDANRSAYDCLFVFK